MVRFGRRGFRFFSRSITNDQNDCALLVSKDEIFLLQTTLGWLYRDISNSLGENAAIHYFQQLVEWDPSLTFELQRLLGSYYQTKYEILLRYIKPQEIEDVAILAKGRNGVVHSAVWNPSRISLYHERRELPVVLKHVIGGSKEGEMDSFLKFLKEVCP